MKIIGFTGTRSGMSERQLASLEFYLKESGCETLHHGDCVGADSQADELARSLGIKIEIHPPSDPKKRAFCHERGPSKLWDEKPYLERNMDIVDVCEWLIAAPKVTAEESSYSGTWATIRYAKKAGRRGILLTR